MTIKLPPLPEPTHRAQISEALAVHSYTTDKLRDYGKSCALAALDEAAKQCEAITACGYSTDINGAIVDKMVKAYRVADVLSALRTELDNTK